MSEGAEPRTVVSWEGPGAPIMLKVYSDAGEVTVPLIPAQAPLPAY